MDNLKMDLDILRRKYGENGWRIMLMTLRDVSSTTRKYTQADKREMGQFIALVNSILLNVLKDK